jgi:hypothetical protein
MAHQLLERALSTLTLAARLLETEPPHHPKAPGEELELSGELWQASEGHEERLLRKIMCLIRLTTALKREAVKSSAELLKEQVEPRPLTQRERLASLRTLEEPNAL